MYKVVAETAACLPADQPRYLMGAGTPEDLVGDSCAGSGAHEHQDGSAEPTSSEAAGPEG